MDVNNIAFRIAVKGFPHVKSTNVLGKLKAAVLEISHASGMVDARTADV